MGCSSSSPSSSLSLVVGLCRMGGPVPDLVNALDLSRNSARAWIPWWVPRMSGGYTGVRFSQGCSGGLDVGGSHGECGYGSGRVRRIGMMRYRCFPR